MISFLGGAGHRNGRPACDGDACPLDRPIRIYRSLPVAVQGRRIGDHESPFGG
jgi:hypothetical protein